MSSLIKSLRRDQQGTTAVEFAIVAPVLIALVVGTMALCVTLYLIGSLHFAVEDGARCRLHPKPLFRSERCCTHLHLRRCPVRKFGECVDQLLDECRVYNLRHSYFGNGLFSLISAFRYAERYRLADTTRCRFSQ